MEEEPQKDTVSAKDETRAQFRDAEHMHKLRERLYERGTPQSDIRYVHRPTHQVPPTVPPTGMPPAQGVPPVAEVNAPTSTDMPKPKKRKTFRMIVSLLGVLFFVGALGTAIAFWFMGTNTISGSNIQIDVTGPVSVGGGEIAQLQVAIQNQNTLPIESATLIVTYPKGTLSVTEVGKELFSERFQLNNIDPGEVVQVPIKVLMYGEENDSKRIMVSVEYRVAGSNATFQKEALPFEFKIGSSPVLITIDSVERISSGQEADLTVTIQSNAGEALNGLVLKATYSQSFNFTKSSPDPVSGQDTWRIETLKPGEKKTIKITGLVSGGEADAGVFNFVVGASGDRDTFIIISPLSAVEREIVIERPFLDVGVKINNADTETVVVEEEETVRVLVSIKNMLESTIYDGVVSVHFTGNAFDELKVNPESEGYYDSEENTLVWDATQLSTLKEILPGGSQNLSFTIVPKKNTDVTPEVRFSVSVGANRVSEDNVSEKINDSTERIIKVANNLAFTSAGLYSDGPFVNSGPVPPIVEKETTYAILFSIKNGTNPVGQGEMTAVLPRYMTWSNKVSEGDVMTYDERSRTITWKIEKLDPHAYEESWIQLAFTPSTSHVDQMPTILETQRFRATDLFTNTVGRSTAPALTTQLENDPSEAVRDGRVRAN